MRVCVLYPYKESSRNTFSLALRLYHVLPQRLYTIPYCISTSGCVRVCVTIATHDIQTPQRSFAYS